MLPRWIPHNRMVADALTKLFHKANVQPILSLMRSGQYQMRSELDEVQYRERLKETGQTLTRMKGKYQEDPADGEAG